VTRDLRLLTGAVFLTATGDFAGLIALILIVHDLTGSGLAVAALWASQMAPVAVLAPAAGLIADRFENRRLLLVVSLGQAAAAGALVFTHALGPILGLSALLGAGAALSGPAEFALVPAVAGGAGLARANGWIESARYAGFTAGPLSAAALAAAGATRAALALNAASFLAVALAAVSLRARRRPAPATRPERARDGFGFLWSDETLRWVVGPAVAALLCISASMTAEVFYIQDVVGAGDAGYALVIASWTMGMVAGATALARRIAARDKAAAALVALAAQGAGMAAGASWALLPVAVAGFLAGGLGHGVKNVLIRTVIQERTPERLLGRTSAAYNGLRNTAELGALAAGGIAVTAVGAQTALFLAGMGPVLAGLAGLAFLRRSTGVAVAQAA
jgi:Na+/melibiose symporter-like transporter